MKPNIFRQSALEKMSSPEKLDVLMTIARPRHWIALLSIFMLLAAFFIWAVAGTLTVKLNGSGVFQLQDGLATIVPAAAGQVTDIGVKPGDVVRRGDAVARLFDPSWPEAGTRDDSPDRAERLLLKSRVVSLQHGRVLKVHVKPGQWVQSGEPLFTLEASGSEEKFEAIVYVPVSQGKSLKPGIAARVWPSGDYASAGGAVFGEVAAVAQVPVTLADMERAMGNRELAAAYLEAGPLVEVRVALQQDAAHPSGMRWTASRAEPGMTVTTGMLCSVEFILGKMHPIEWMF
ncbi:HlyD family secretion protein [Paenibacillus sp. UNCCL117]|uniref:HlyD family efflux transporter periplasmic adaptor subunit n=1 Tax=unclassified Paenibacillus TaxID=185978 RepID=UPI00088080E0|nr:MULTISPECIES: HlyD family efflux transporter periplasmic adaptor subunit [unclassified Paenibacillus]SDC13343.1 HlyD family secretion protein [Paenibacillus sp. cl123]SFW17042.1 HlyD family secretion protein [Paenibacillus sp. UNCCL117]